MDGRTFKVDNRLKELRKNNMKNLLYIVCGGLLFVQLAGCVAPAVSTEPVTAEATSASADESTVTCEAGYRLFVHLRAEICIPETPQRVVALGGQHIMLPLFELGFTNIIGAVGTIEGSAEPFFERMQDYDTSGVTFVGERGTPDPEIILGLQPDLIIGNQWDIPEEVYDTYAQIAPTVVIETHTRPIRESVKELGELVGLTDQADELEARYVAEVTKLRDTLGDPAEYDFSIIAFQGNGQFSVDPVGVLTDLGVTLPAAHVAAIESEDAANTFSIEELPNFDGDVILVRYWSSDHGAQGIEFIETLPDVRPLWQTLQAVERSQVYEIPTEEWYGQAYQPLFNMVSDLSEYLLNNEIDTSYAR
jgi:iron complex transport system substrate-binding protein